MITNALQTNNVSTLLLTFLLGTWAIKQGTSENRKVGLYSNSL